MDATANASVRKHPRDAFAGVWAATRAALAGLVMALAIPASADVLDVPDSPPEVVELGEQPTRGVTKALVQDRFGEPEARVPAVGEPPIARWDYDAFSVYFEHNRVLHVVVHTETAEAR